MRVSDVRIRISQIKVAAERRAHEEAHALADELYLDVLKAYAAGSRNNKLAQAALEVEKIEFERHCA